MAETQGVEAVFQSTPSAWRETGFFTPVCYPRSISIHSLRMEGDVAIFHCITERLSFQSTPSAWRETVKAWLLCPCKRISIHSLRMEGDINI